MGPRAGHLQIRWKWNSSGDVEDYFSETRCGFAVGSAAVHSVHGDGPYVVQKGNVPVQAAIGERTLCAEQLHQHPVLCALQEREGSGYGSLFRE